MALEGAAIRRRLAELGASVPGLSVVAATGSTNDDARAAAAGGAPSGSVFVADRQSAGRGRRGRTWHSPAGENVYLSVIARPSVEPERISGISLAAGIAVARVVDDLLGADRARIKWPNDLWVDGCKIAGVLVESALGGETAPTCIVGVGLNVHAESFPDDPTYAVAPTSLALAGVRAVDRNRLVAELVASLHGCLQGWMRSGLERFAGELEARDALRGRRVEVDGRAGVAAGVRADGALWIVDDAGERQAVVAGEVTLR